MAVGKATRPVTSFSRERQRWGSLNTVLCTALAAYILYLVVGILYRHPSRFDLTQERLHSLSDKTLARLQLIREEIEVIFPRFHPYGDPQQIAEQVAHYLALLRARDLLDEYMIHQPLVKVVADVDVHSEPDRWQQVQEEYNLLPTQWNRLIFTARDEDGKRYTQMVTARDVADFAAASAGIDTPPKITEFYGEEAINGALMRLIHRQRRKVYFTQDKGELTLLPGRGRASGMAAVRHELEASGFEVEELALSSLEEIPGDCELLVIAGPEEAYSENELDAIERYLSRDGRLFVSLGQKRTGLETLLGKWGVEVGSGKISMRHLSDGTKLDTYWVAAGTFHPTHPITKPFGSARFEARLFMPRALKAAGAAQKLETVQLLGTGRSKDDVKYLYEEGEVKDVRHRDGGVAIATATWQPPLERPPPGWQQRKVRLVVVGSSSFLRDPERHARVRGGFLSFSHRDLFMNCVHWLMGEERQAAVDSKKMEDRMIKTSPGIRIFLILSSVVIFPGVFVLLGVFLYVWRRT